MIAYTDKVSIDSNPNPEVNKWTAANANEVKQEVNTHISLTNNPHSVTKSHIGLGNVDNTTDLGKPISTLTQAALDLKANIGGGSQLSWYNVAQNGFVLDGVTDNSAAFTALVALAPNGSTFYFPVGTCYLLTVVTIPKTINLIGDGHYSVISTDQNITMLDYTDSDAAWATFITGLRVDNIRLLNTNVGTPSSASIGLKSEGTYFLESHNLTVHGFYKNIQCVNIVSDSWVGLRCEAYVHTGMERINNTGFKDAGDGCIVNSWFLPQVRNSTYSIYYENGGGLKISNTKFNWDGVFKAQYHLFYDAHGTTVDILVSNCSFENYSAAAIKVKETTGSISEIMIIGNDIGGTTNAGNEGVDIDGVEHVTVVGNVFKGGASSSTAIKLNNVDNVVESGNVFDGWTNNFTTSGTATQVNRAVYTRSFIDKLTPTGAINSSNTVYTVGVPPVAGSDHVYLNGSLKTGGGVDYTLSDTTFTFVVAPTTGDKLFISFRIQL